MGENKKKPNVLGEHYFRFRTCGVAYPFGLTALQEVNIFKFQIKQNLNREQSCVNCETRILVEKEPVVIITANKKDVCNLPSGSTAIESVSEMIF